MSALGLRGRLKSAECEGRGRRTRSSDHVQRALSDPVQDVDLSRLVVADESVELVLELHRRRVGMKRSETGFLADGGKEGDGPRTRARRRAG